MTVTTEHPSPLHQLISGELRLLELLTTGAPLPILLDAFVNSFESSFPDAICSAMLLTTDGLHLQHGAAPSLPMAYQKAIAGLAIGPCAGSCGAAAFTRQTLSLIHI